MGNLSRYKNLGDFHTHTIYSFHAMSSPTEMVDAAIAKGLKYIALTDHYYPNDDYEHLQCMNANQILMKNQSARIHEIPVQFEAVKDKITVIPGYEHNVFTTSEPEDLDNSIKPFNILGVHNWFYIHGITSGSLITDIRGKIKTGRYQCFSHLEREMMFFAGWPNDEEKRFKHMKDVMFDIVDICGANNILLEVNESSLFRDKNLKLGDPGNRVRMNYWLEFAKLHRCLIIINTDSHSKYTVGDIRKSIELLEFLKYPEDLIVNFDDSKIKELVMREIKYTPTRF